MLSLYRGSSRTSISYSSPWSRNSEALVPLIKVEIALAPRNKDLREMPAWYNTIDVYVCASSSEGLSLSVLEAMACGRPIVSTIPNEIPNQIIVNRDVSSIAAGIEQARGMSAPVDKEWSWENRSKAWIDFLTA